MRHAYRNAYLLFLVFVLSVVTGCASYWGQYFDEQEKLNETYHGQFWEEKPDYYGAHGTYNVP